MRFIATVVVVAGVAAPLFSATPPTDQIRRGQELFLKSPKGVACGTCHEMAHLGNAVGPSLKNIATYATPRGVVVAIRMSSTETVQLVTPASGDKFPARIVEKQDGVYKFWKLDALPPVLVTLPEKEVTSIERDQKWKHPPAAAGYTSNELADIVGFLRWAATGSQKVVTEDEVATSQ